MHQTQRSLLFAFHTLLNEVISVNLGCWLHFDSEKQNPKTFVSFIAQALQNIKNTA